MARRIGSRGLLRAAIALALALGGQASPAEVPRDRCSGSPGILSDLHDTTWSIVLHAHQGQECSIDLWESSADGDSWIEAVNPRVITAPTHGVAEAIGEPARDLSSQRATEDAANDLRQAHPHRRSLFINLSKSRFVYRSAPGYLGDDHFVVEVNLIQDDVAVTARIDVEVAVSSGAINYICAVGPKSVAAFVPPGSYCARRDDFTIQHSDDGVIATH
jgi:hypothetical protein